MPFPYSYRSTIELLGNKIRGVKPNESLILNILYKKLKDKSGHNTGLTNGNLVYSAQAGIFKFEYDVKISVENRADDININYEINISRIINVILIIVIFSALISFFSVKLFLISSFLFSSLFYVLNLIYINGLVKKDLESSIGENLYRFNEKEEFTDEQLDWMKDKFRCPACGEYLSIFDIDCPDCGLRIKKSRRQLPVDSSKYKDEKITYHFRKNS